MSAAVIDFHGLFDVVWVSLVAGVGATVLYSLVVLGWSRAMVARRDGDAAAVVRYGLLAAAAALLCAAAVAYGVTVMLSSK